MQSRETYVLSIYQFRYICQQTANNRRIENYRSCILDCASTIRLNDRNIKAWYRSASACLALDKLAEADDACTRGLEIEQNNTALKALLVKIQKRQEHLANVEKQRREREERKAAEAQTLIWKMQR